LALISDETNQQWSWIYENTDDETQTEMRMEQGEQIRSVQVGIVTCSQVSTHGNRQMSLFTVTCKISWKC